MGSSSGAIDSSNIGFQLLKKCGWKEGTGLGVSEQGRLEPLQTHVKKNKLGLGAEVIKRKKTHNPADKMKQTKMHILEESSSELQNENVSTQPKKKTKLASKRLWKMLEEEKRLKEKEFERDFFREFWPDNV
uniref:G patch domain and ankyrin repeat-containing protein 1 n=1 Tax=Anthurium amnicola TaxID=1678845 RepID=A0A1D1Z8Q7_9ARAE